MLEYRIIEDVQTAFEFKETLTPGMDFDTFEKYYSIHPDLFIAVYTDDIIIALVFPQLDYPENTSIQRDTLILAGIAIKKSLQKQGVGSRLLKKFEQQAAAIGFRKINLCSADNVDMFYSKNGYVPISLRVEIALEDLPQDYQELGYTIMDERAEDQSVIYFYIPVSQEIISSDHKAIVKKKFNARDVLYIFEKIIAGID